MATNNVPTQNYIDLADSDDELVPARPLTTAKVVAAPLSSSNGMAQESTLQNLNAANPADVITGLASASISDHNGARQDQQAFSSSPWMGDGPSTAMLLDPTQSGASTSRLNLDDRPPLDLQANVTRSRQDELPASLPFEPTMDMYNAPQPGIDCPIDYSTGPFASIPPQQPLISRNRWDSEDEGDSTSETREELVQEFRTGLVYSSVMMLHAVPSFIDEETEEDIHPERPERISQIFDTLKRGGCVARMKRIPIRDVTMEEVMLVHNRAMWEGVQRTSFFTSNTLAIQTKHLEKGYSLYVNEHSARCARLSCGGVIEMCDAVASGRVHNGFALVRPPGHHAEPDRSMGFCFYNNVAVAARFIQEKYQEKCQKILILDWDVHHGNGTQSAFWEDENIVYISIHRYEDGQFFPGGKAGNYDQVGAGKGLGKNINIPWPDKGMTDADYISAFQRIIMPIACEFAPDMVIISAGFDAAEGDSLGECHVSPTGYAQMTYDLASLANGKLVVALEGGYNLDSIAKSALSVTQVLLGESPPPAIAGMAPSSIASDALNDVEKVQSRYWKSIRSSPYAIIEEQEAVGMDKIGLAKMFALHRTFEIGKKYNLDALPIALASSRGEEDEVFTGQVMCSSGLFEESFDTMIIFAHDAGNLRVEEHGMDIDLEEELGYFLSGSSKVVEWAKKHNAALIDISLHAQVPTISKTPISGTSRRNRNPNQARLANRLEEDKRLLLYAWDNAAVMVLSAKTEMKVILIGLGTATEAILHLIEERNVEACVAGVIQLPAYSLIPTVSKNNPEKRIWYYKNSRVFLPRDHAYYTLDAQAKSGKRLGKVIRSEEKRAIQVLNAEFPTIETYIERCLSG